VKKVVLTVVLKAQQKVVQWVAWKAVRKEWMLVCTWVVQ
jgi:hypothetical protein